MISVIIPAKNEQKFLECTLLHTRKVFDELNLSYEIIVCDNGSTDATSKIAKKHADLVVYEKIPHISKARNLGARASNGEFLIFIDSDTKITKKLMKYTLLKLKTKKIVSAISSYDNYPNLQSLGIWLYNILSMMFKLGVGQFIATSKDDFIKADAFNTSIYAFEDIELLKTYKKMFGRSYVLIAPYTVKTSSRKMTSGKSTKHFLQLLAGYLLGYDVASSKEKLVYWYKDNIKSSNSEKLKSISFLILFFLLTFQQSFIYTFNSIYTQNIGFLTLLIFVLFVISTFTNIKTFLFISLTTFIIELIGVKTGFPFGFYTYNTSDYWQAVLGVPIIISLAWYVIIITLTRIFKNPFLVGLNAIFIDVFIEDFALQKNIWIWNTSSIFTAPIVNYLSWGILSGLVSFIVINKFQYKNLSLFFASVCYGVLFLSIISFGFNIITFLILFYLGLIFYFAFSQSIKELLNS